MDQFNLAENVDMLFHSLENFTQKEGVIGKPVMQSDKTFMPVVSVTIGYGGGNASMGKGQNVAPIASVSGNSSSATGALGLGAKLNTEAIIVVENENVQLLPISAAGAAGSLVNKIPQMISGVMQNKQPGQSAQQQPGQSQ